MAVAVIDCAHYETISYVEGIETGECLYCGQIKKYVDGKVTITRPGDPAKARPKKAEVPASAEQMPTEEQAVEEAVPPRPEKRWKLRAYFEQNKEAMIADYRSMSHLKFLRRWGISPTTWMKLQQDWGVPSKGRGGKHLAKSFRDKRVKPPSTEEVSKKAEKAAREINRGVAVEILELRKQLAGLRVALPAFPPFDKNWSFIVQEAWLDAYCRIAELNQRVQAPRG